MSLLSVQSLAKKNIATLFMPGKALLMDLEDNMKILGRGLQDADGQFYIDDQQNGPLVVLKRTERANIVTVTAVARAHYAATKTEVETASSPLPIFKVSGRHKTIFPVMESATTLAKNKSNLPNGMKTNSVNFFEEERVLHLRLGRALLLRSVKGYIAKSLLSRVVPTGKECEPCSKGKYRHRFGGLLTTATKPGRLHCDTKGQVTVTLEDGQKYFLTVFEEYSSFTYVCSIRSKSEASEVLLALSSVLRSSRATQSQLYTCTGVPSSGVHEISWITMAWTSLRRRATRPSQTGRPNERMVFS